MMTDFPRRFALALLSLTLVHVLCPVPAHALREFNKSFEKRYVKTSDNEDFQRVYRKAKCFVCHVKGKKKDVCNSYGEELARLIEGNAQERLDLAKQEDRKPAELKKLLAELEAAMTAAEAKRPAEDGPTYGEILSSGQMPVPLPEGGSDDEDEDDEEEGEEEE